MTKILGKKLNMTQKFSDDGTVTPVTEVKLEEKAELKVGDKVKVTGTSKGKGFQGVVKRWGFKGSPASHGHKDQLRMPGSIGAGGPQHVFKGTRMGGRMGGDKITVTNLEVIEVNEKDNTVYLKGAVPGARNSLLTIKK